MRKSFTRFLSVLMLFCAFGLQAAFAESLFNGAGSTPKDDDMNVTPASIATQFVLAFSDTPTITTNGGTLVIYKDDAIYKLVPITKTSADVSVVGKTIVVKHGIASFPEGSAYSLVLLQGVTVNGNPASIAMGDENFQIGDFTAPKLAATNPLTPVGGGVKANLTYPGGPDLPFQLTLTFDENIALGTGDIAVYKENGTVMDIIRVGEEGAPVEITGKTATVSVDDNSYFAPETNYYVKVDAGAFTDASENHNKFGGILTNTGWTFSTRVNVAPTITASVTDVAATSAKLNVSISQAGSFKYLIATSNPANDAGFTTVSNVAANTNKVVDITGLTGGVTYYAYVIASNSADPANVTSLADAIAARKEFKTTDDTGPVADSRGLVKTDKKTSGVYIIFNEKVVGGTGYLDVRKATDNTLMFHVPASAVTCAAVPETDPVEWKATIDFGGTLASNENYYVVFPVGYIKDMYGNSYGDDVPGLTVPVNYTGPASWLITSADFEAPVVTFTTPAALTDKVVINFNEAVELADGEGWPSSGDFFNWSKYVAFQKNGVTVPAGFSVVGNTIEITPGSALTSNTKYNVVLRPGVVQDMSDNHNVLAAAQTKEFTTGDLDPLHATFAPASGNLNDYTPLTITFNKAVRAIKTGDPAYEALTNTNVKATVKLEKTLNSVTTEVDPADYSATYDATAHKITVVPVNGKPFQTASASDVVSYTLSIRADKIEDNGGTDVEDVVNPVPTTFWTWAVNDYKKPVATLMANEVVNDGTLEYLTISFDEPVSAVSATDPFAYAVLKMVDAQGNNIDFTAELVGNELRLTPDEAELAVGKTLYYGIGASMKDGAGNVNNAVYKSVKIVGPAVPPTIHAVSYTVNGSASTPIDQVLAGVAKNTDGKIIVKVTFDVNIDDEDVTKKLVTSLLAAPGEFTVSATDVSGKVLTMTITPTQIPAAEQPATHTITIPVGLVEANEAYTNDPAPTFAQLAAPVTITVKTKDTELPVVSADWDGDTDVAMDATLELMFSEPVTPVAGKTIKFNYGSGPTTAETVSITSANVVKVDEDGMVWEVKHAAFNQYFTEYSVVIAKDAFVDAANNNLGANDVIFTLETMHNTFAGIKTLVPSDGADLVGTSVNLNIEFKEPVAKGVEGATRKVIYVIEKVGDNADYTIDGVTGDLVLASGGDDVVKTYAYVDDDQKVTISGATVTVSGVTLLAGKEYYVLITPESFKDIVNPTSEVAYYDGITSYGAWNFFTKDVYAPEVVLSFDKLGPDGLAAKNSNIILTFSKPIVKNSDGAAITNSSLPSLVKLEKWDGEGWQNLAYTGTITGENVITIDNSSLVVLGELKTDNQYRVSFGGTTFKGKVSGATLGAFSEEFWTTDATAPVVAVTFQTPDEVNDVTYNTTDGHIANLKITASDVNSELEDHTAIKVYYLKSTTDLTMTGTEVKGLAEANKSLAGNDNFDVQYKGGMASGTKYFVYAVAEDVAGNLSTVAKFPFITDDVVKPALAGALPTSFDKDGNIQLVFNEPVVPVEGAYARVIDNATHITYTMPLANLDGEDADANAITIVGGEFAQMLDDVASYTIEIDPGMIVDVPREVGEGDMVNEPNAWDGIVGTSFVVASKDQVLPELVSTDPNNDSEAYPIVDINPTFTLNFSEPVNLNSTFTNFLVYEFIDAPDAMRLKSASIAPADPYDILTASNVSGAGTSTITLSTNRALVSGHRYYVVIKDGTFSDLAGNKWVNDPEAEGPVDVTIDFEAKDIMPLPVTFRCPQDGEPFYLPTDEPLEFVPDNVCIVFAEWDGVSGWDGDATNYENFYLNPNDEYVNTYDLLTHIFLTVDGQAVPFTIGNGGDRIWIYADGGFNQYKGKTINYGFVNLYDNNGNLNTGADVTFSIQPDAIVKRDVMFVPGDNDDNATTKVNIAVDQTFKIEFSKDGSDNKLYSYHATSEALNNLIVTAAWLNSNGVFTMEGADLTVTAVDFVNGKTVVTIVADEPLNSEEVYTLEINEDKIQIGQGHDPLGYYAETFITADVQAPRLIAEDGETLDAAYMPVKSGVAGKDQMLALVFDEEVKGMGSIIIHRWDGVAVATVDITGVMSEETEAGWQLNIGKPVDIMTSNPDFVTDKDYYIEVPAGVVIDMAATPNSFAGITTVNEWKISLRDDTTPQVVFVDNTKSGIAVDTKIKLTFDRPVVMGKGWLALYYEDGKAVDLIRTDAGATAMTSYDFMLNRELAPNTKFFVELGEGTFDLAADPSIMQEQQNIGNWYFSTEVNAAPTAMEYVPAKTDPRATGVELTSELSITFDMDVVPGTGNIQLHRKQNVGGPIITNFDVTDPTQVVFEGNKVTIPGNVLKLQNNSEYYVIIPATAIKNTSTTPEFWAGITVPFVWQFTTLNDEVAPTAELAPMETGLIPSEIALTMTFNEPVVAGMGNVTIYDAVADTVVETIAVDETMLDGQVVTLMPTKLDDGMSYYVMVDAGVVKDLAGNEYEGVADKTTWTFATADLTAPALTDWTPNMVTIADNHPTFVMTFSEDVVAGEGNLVVYKKDGDVATLTIPVNAAMVSGNTVTVDYVTTNGLDKNTDYYVFVDGSAIKDVAGNEFAGVADAAAWTFKTGDSFVDNVDPKNASQFKVYPNPFVDFVNVENASKLNRIVVTNIAGQVVKEIVNPTNRIQLNELRSGIYFMSLYNTDNVIAKTAKIVKR